MKKIKDKIAQEKGYNNWDDYEKWIIEVNQPVAIAQLLVGAMEEACNEYYQNNNAETVLAELLNKLKSNKTPNLGGGMRVIEHNIDCVETTINLLKIGGN